METHPIPLRPPLELTQVEFTEGLPQALIAILERRYLASFDADDWEVTVRDRDRGKPLLREVLSLGRPANSPHGWPVAMPSVLAACHDPGQALVTLLHARDGANRLYFGARRVVGVGAYSTADHLSAQESALKATFPGIELGPVRSLEDEEMGELSTLLAATPWLAVMTGVPSRRANVATSQSIDRVVAAVGPGRYALMVVAEPLPESDINAAIDHCRRLKSEIHSYVRLTIQRSRGESRSETSNSTDESTAWKTGLPTTLYMLASFCSQFPAGRVIRGAVLGAAMIGSGAAAQQSRSATTGESWSQSGGVELLDANAQACERILDRQIERLQRARAGGWWKTAIYIAAETEACLRKVGGALRTLIAGDDGETDPVRMVQPPDEILRESILRGRLMRLRPRRADRGHPLGEAFDALATCLTSDELAVLTAPPQEEIAGIPMRARATFALTLPAEEGTIELASLEDGGGHLLAPVRLTAAQLNRHVLIAGVSGSGKSNTCMRLLLAAHRAGNTPFLVIEPVKREYRTLATLPELRGRLRVYAAGSTSGLPLRLNPLLPVAGISIGRHVDMLKAVFNASFPMHAGMPYVLEEALIDVYVERGWSLTDVYNSHLPDDADIDLRSALVPDLRDLHDKVDEVLARKHYSQEIQLNLGAALRSRLNSLLVGSKGALLDTRRSTPVEDLFAGPAVIELQDLSDENEKAFVMALLLALLYEHTEIRQHSAPDRYDQLQHLTLIEEAHRLLSTSQGPRTSEVGDARGKAVSMFTDMLAEMRAYGEGFLIADQVPTQLAPQIVKNTGLKILHRITAPDDRQLCGSCINLSEEQTRALNNLRTGQAVVHDEQIGEAVLVRVAATKPPHAEGDSAGPGLVDGAFVRRTLQRNAGCRSCPAPCDFYLRLREKGAIEPGQDLVAFLEALLFTEGSDPWQAWGLWRARWVARAEGYFGRVADRDQAAYCAVTQGAHAWLGKYLATRRKGLLTPQDHFARETAAAAIGELATAWLGARELDASGCLALRVAQTNLRSVLSTHPPVELAGCALCPCRCQMLPFVNPQLDGVRKQIGVASGMASRSLAALERTLDPVWKRAQASGLSGARRRSWMYCVVAHLDLPQNDSLLLALREPIPVAERQELSDVFGGEAVPDD